MSNLSNLICRANFLENRNSKKKKLKIDIIIIACARNDWVVLTRLKIRPCEKFIVKLHKLSRNNISHTYRVK